MIEVENHAMLIELIAEPLPVTHLEPVAVALEALLKSQLQASGYKVGCSRRFLSTHRIAYLLQEIRLDQATEGRWVKGPSRTIAWEDGGWSAAAQAWAKRLHVSLDHAVWRETRGKSELWAEVKSVQRPLHEIILPILQQSLTRLTLPVQTKWEAGDGVWSFLRPIRKIGVTLEGPQAEGSVMGVEVAHHQTWIDLPHAKALHFERPERYVEALAAEGIEIDDQRRKASLILKLKRLAAEVEGVLELDEAHLDRLATVFERPHVWRGALQPQHAQLPMAALSLHLKQEMFSFAIRSDDKLGQALPYFLTVTAQWDPKIQRDFEWVTSARLEDLRFFYEMDVATPWEHWQRGLETSVIHPKLGSTAKKVERLKEIGLKLASTLPEIDRAVFHRAVVLCKCDERSRLCMEMPELIGLMGAHHAALRHEDPAVVETIRSHVRPRHASDDLPSTPEGALLSLVDHLDHLVGWIGAGASPSGAQDPFALRPSAAAVIRILIEKKWRWDLTLLVSFAYATYPEHLFKMETVHLVVQYLLQRYQRWLDKQNHARSMIRAVFATKEKSPLKLMMSLKSLERWIERAPEEAHQALQTCKRVEGLLKSCALPLLPLNLRKLEEVEVWSSLHPSAHALAVCIDALQSYSLDLDPKSFDDFWSLLSKLVNAVELLFASVHFSKTTEAQQSTYFALLQQAAFALQRLVHFEMLVLRD